MPSLMKSSGDGKTTYAIQWQLPACTFCRGRKTRLPQAVNNPKFFELVLKLSDGNFCAKASMLSVLSFDSAYVLPRHGDENLLHGNARNAFKAIVMHKLCTTSYAQNVDNFLKRRHIHAISAGASSLFRQKTARNC